MKEIIFGMLVLSSISIFASEKDVCIVRTPLESFRKHSTLKDCMLFGKDKAETYYISSSGNSVSVYHSDLGLDKKLEITVKDIAVSPLDWTDVDH